MSKAKGIIAVLAGWLAVCGIQLLYGIRMESTMFSNSVFCMAAFGAFSFAVFSFLKQEPDRRTCLFGLAGGLLFAAMTCFGFSLNYTDTIWHRAVFLALLCLLPFFSACTGWGLLAACRIRFSESGYVGEKASGNVRSGKYLKTFSRLTERQWFFVFWGILFLSWIPVLLASWPGIFSYDCGWQLISFADGSLSAHHPIAHTVLLGVCMELGQTLFGSNNAGAALYSLVQMALMSGLYAYVCLYLRRRRAPRFLWIGAVCFFGFHPVNGLMALCATKDSIFSALFAVFMVELMEIFRDRELFFASLKRQAVFAGTMLLLFAFRNNALHTMLLSAPFFLWFFRKYWKRLAVLLLLTLGLWKLYTGPVYQALSVEPGDPREMCSVLMQSAARVYNLAYEDLSEEQRAAFLSIIEEEGMEAYLSRFADPVKAYFNGKAFVRNPGPFLKAWLSAGMTHKKIYVDSFLANTFGYWYPGNSIEDTKNGRDYFEYCCKEFREDIDVTMSPKLPALSEVYRKIGNEAAFQKVPVLAAVFNLGTYTWLLLFLTLLLLCRRQYQKLVLVIPLWMYFATTLLGPVVKMRYIYPLIACTPLLIYLVIRQEDASWTK